MQLAIDGLIALVVVVSHLVILARMAYLDVFTYRYIPYVIVVTAVKWLAKVFTSRDIFQLGDFPGFGGEDIDSAAICSYPQLPFPFGEA